MRTLSLSHKIEAEENPIQTDTMDKIFGNAYRGDPGVPHTDPEQFVDIWMGSFAFSAITWFNPYIWQISNAYKYFFFVFSFQGQGFDYSDQGFCVLSFCLCFGYGDTAIGFSTCLCCHLIREMMYLVRGIAPFGTVGFGWPSNEQLRLRLPQLRTFLLVDMVLDANTSLKVNILI